MINLHNVIHVYFLSPGINLNTGKQGIFPSVYATDLSFYETDAELEPKSQTVAQIFQLHYLGSLEVNHYKGTDVLMDAIERVSSTVRHSL